MANKQYQKGVRLEREVVNMIKAGGGQATRTAGSHGWVDVVGKLTYPTEVELADVLPGFDVLPAFKLGYDLTLQRVGKKYVDTLFIETYHQQSSVFLIQCKRKAVKHG